MAPFTSRQTNYIRAIAGQQQHKTLICRQAETSLVPFNPPNLRNATGTGGASLYGLSWYLNNAPKCHYAGAPTDPVSNAMESSDYGCCNLNLFNTYEGSVTTDTRGRLYLLRIPAITTTSAATDGGVGHNHEIDESKFIESKYRAGVEGYLESTHMKLFCTLPIHSDASDTGVLGSPHYEFRIIVFRNKLPVWNPEMAAEHDRKTVRDGVSLLNPNYDLFMGQTGRPRGFLGYRESKNLDLGFNGDLERYRGKRWLGGATSATNGDGDVMPDSELLFTTKDYMTMPLNRNDYVVHTDQRFFLGKEQGKSHMEKEFHFDWNDFIDTPASDLTSSPTLDKKNYDWQFLILGTSNSQEPADLKVELRATTSMKSGM